MNAIVSSMLSSMPRAGGSIVRKVSIVGSVGMAVILLLVSLLISVYFTRHERQNIERWIGGQAEGKADTIAAMDLTARDMARRAFPVLRQEFSGSAFSLDTATGALSYGGTPLAGSTDSVDRFAQAAGGVATILARQGDDFLRIATSLKKPEGGRAVGTVLGAGHPARAPLLAGKPYTGTALLFGHPFMTHYEPVRDAQGAVVGALFVGFDTSEFQSSVEKIVLDSRFYGTGGLLVIDPGKDLADATFVIHPTAKGRKVSELLPNAAQVLAQLGRNEGSMVRDMPSLLDGKSSDRMLYLHRNAGTGWWVVADVSESEAMRGLWTSLSILWSMLTVGSLLLGMGLLWLIHAWVALPLRKLGRAITTVTHGDLTQPVHSRQRDEVGALIREVEAMRSQFNQTLTGVRNAVDSITTASGEIAAGNQDLSNRTEQTASQLQRTAQSMEQITATVRQSSDSASQANQLAASATQTASDGGRIVHEVVSTMERIDQSSRKIADIIGVIDAIAFQTNILALNAAVEAARAGEQGRGFAVVAGEVRALAQRSAEAAKEIKQLIGASVAQVQSGSTLVHKAGGTMEEIVGAVRHVGDIIGEISAASSEQSQGIGEVNAAVSQLDQMTQQNAALVEQSAAAAASLREQAARLMAAVQVFRLAASVGGGMVTALPAGDTAPRKLASA